LPEIQLGVSAFIPEEYVQDVHQRLVLYKRVSLAANDEDLNQIKCELQDCYGKLPSSVDNLLQIISIRNFLKPLKVKRWAMTVNICNIFFRDTSPVDPAKIIAFYQQEN